MRHCVTPIVTILIFTIGTHTEARGHCVGGSVVARRRKMVIGLALGVSLLAGPFALALILQSAVLD